MGREGSEGRERRDREKEKTEKEERQTEIYLPSQRWQKERDKQYTLNYCNFKLGSPTALQLTD